jgi:uncharacterized protein YbjT (DUF2867 family)
MILAETLLKRGNRIRAIGRDREKLKTLAGKGAETFSTSFDDPAELTKAFVGSDAVFCLMPPGYAVDDYEAFQDKVGETIKQALTKSNIHYVLNLSSLGANKPEGTGPIKGLSRHEKRLNSIININVLHLRPGFFMENLFMSLPLIKSSGKIGFPLRSDLPIPMIATKDIGLKAAELLEALNFSGQSVFDLAGPRELTMKEASAVIGKTIGNHPLTYEQLSFQEAEKGMLSLGMKPKMVKLMLEMYEAFNDGKIMQEHLTIEHRGKTTIEEFAKTTFSQALEADRKKVMA